MSRYKWYATQPIYQWLLADEFICFLKDLSSETARSAPSDLDPVGRLVADSAADGFTDGSILVIWLTGGCSGHKKFNDFMFELFGHYEIIACLLLLCNFILSTKGAFSAYHL